MADMRNLSLTFSLKLAKIMNYYTNIHYNVNIPKNCVGNTVFL